MQEADVTSRFPRLPPAPDPPRPSPLPPSPLPPPSPLQPPAPPGYYTTYVFKLKPTHHLYDAHAPRPLAVRRCGCSCFVGDESVDGEHFWDEIQVRARATEVEGSAVLYLAHAVLSRGFAVDNQGRAFLPDASLSRHVESPALRSRTAHLVSGYVEGSGPQLISRHALGYYADQEPGWWPDSNNLAWQTMANNSDPHTKEGLVFWRDVCASTCTRLHFDHESARYAALNFDPAVALHGRCSCYAAGANESVSAPTDTEALEFLRDHFGARIPTNGTDYVHVFALDATLFESLFVPEVQGTIYYEPMWTDHLDFDGVLATAPVTIASTSFALATRDECLAKCAIDAVSRAAALRSVRFAATPKSVGTVDAFWCQCFEDRLLLPEHSAAWKRLPDFPADTSLHVEFFDVRLCQFVRANAASIVWSKTSIAPNPESGYCRGSLVGGGQTIETVTIDTLHGAAQPFDSLCRARCQDDPSCQFAHVFDSTFDSLNLLHAQPPPPSPPSPPSPPPSPVPPLPPLPPQPPPGGVLDGTSSLRTFLPGIGTAPANTDAGFVVTCRVPSCGVGETGEGADLPIFVTSSQLAALSVASEVKRLDVVCPYECAHTVVEHGVGIESLEQLRTVGSLPNTFLQYLGLGEAATSGTPQGDEFVRSATRLGFAVLEPVDSTSGLTMHECRARVELQKVLTMHAVWLATGVTGALATGTCTTYLAARSQQQLTLWQSFYAHMRNVLTPVFLNAFRPTAAAATPPASGFACDPRAMTPTSTTSATAVLRDPAWQACLFWVEVDTDANDQLACSPEREGGNGRSNLKDSNHHITTHTTYPFLLILHGNYRLLFHRRYIVVLF
jgi:hypothetical protein